MNKNTVSSVYQHYPDRNYSTTGKGTALYYMGATHIPMTEIVITLNTGGDLVYKNGLLILVPSNNKEIIYYRIEE